MRPVSTAMQKALVNTGARVLTHGIAAARADSPAVTGATGGFAFPGSAGLTPSPPVVYSSVARSCHPRKRRHRHRRRRFLPRLSLGLSEATQGEHSGMCLAPSPLSGMPPTACWSVCPESQTPTQKAATTLPVRSSRVNARGRTTQSRRLWGHGRSHRVRRRVRAQGVPGVGSTWHPGGEDAVCEDVNQVTPAE